MSDTPKKLQIKTAGHTLPLTCELGKWRCGDIRDGISFEFGNEGGWVVPLSELERIVDAARAERKIPTLAAKDRLLEQMADALRRAKGHVATNHRSRKKTRQEVLAQIRDALAEYAETRPIQVDPAPAPQ